ncbi:hypothetical protein LCGC14_0195200 [marine sediment metagenome]|uniref:Uncharacterized protein n=1 Tax=marine sediment metagenome TaxID=412755 RepID=A0A0F9V1T9_9ZZZZ
MPFYDILMFGYQPKTEDGIRDVYKKITESEFRHFPKEFDDLTGRELEDRFLLRLSNKLNFRLQETQIEVLVEISGMDSNTVRQLIYNDKTNKPGRCIAPSAIYFECHPEVGFEYPEDLIIGVPFTSRYVPTLIDWQEEHGGVHLFEINTEWLQIAIDKFEKNLPDAKLFMVTTFA